MAESSSVYAALIVGIAVGLALIVYAEATGGEMKMVLVGAGGTLGLLCVAVLSLVIARLPEPEHGEEH